ncbi:DUF4244 domain-containing protein [Leucobacter chromiireducens]|uniref:DUF4244 domain-containing protein n=1 Tax=Leucobacter chromiireducens subsp. solipictus TaxID=398235 RepID=A0ABS1SFI8_9MICO|nr:DUF4244 domain-containing protein [Leucobacter chromiireducens]MBL3678631.1 DUF4244 domain-containing protein [Leucobacter chromiireducens subsp. solipictus]
MHSHLTLVPERPNRAPAPPSPLRRWGRSARRSLRASAARLGTEERGAVTAEYAIVILAAVAFAGLLVAIMQSAEIRAMLVQLVENALGAGS